MSSWGYVAAGYALTFLLLALVSWRSESRIAALRRRLREGRGRSSG